MRAEDCGSGFRSANGSPKADDTRTDWFWFQNQHKAISFFGAINVSASGSKMVSGIACQSIPNP